MAAPAEAAMSAQLMHAQRLFLLATGISSLGDGAFVTAAPLAAAAITRQPAMVSLIAVVEYLPWVFLSPYAGVFVDRWPKRPVMVAADLLRAAAVGLIAWLAWQHALSIPFLALAAVAIVAGTVFHDSAGQAIVAEIAERDPEMLNRLNGRAAAATTSGRQLAGPATGSSLFAVAPWGPFLLDAVSFAASAAALAGLPSRFAASQPREGPGVHEAIRKGARFVWRSPLLRGLCGLVAIANLTYNLAWSTFVLLATSRDGLGLSAVGFGVVVTAMAVGGVLGGLVAARTILRIGAVQVVLGCLLLEAGVWTVIALTHSPVVAGAGLAVEGLCTTFVTVVAMSARQQAAPPELLARVITAFRVVAVGAAPVGAAAGGLIASVWGLRAPLWCAAAILVVASLALIRPIRDLDG